MTDWLLIQNTFNKAMHSLRNMFGCIQRQLDNTMNSTINWVRNEPSDRSRINSSRTISSVTSTCGSRIRVIRRERSPHRENQRTRSRSNLRRTAETDKCSICLGQFDRGRRKYFLPCRHYFHRQCLLAWLEIKSTCPLCRRSAFNDDYDDTDDSLSD